MDSNLSLADIAAVTNGNGDGMFGGNGMWFFALIVLLLIGNNGLFGGRGEFGQYATAASQQDILFGQKFSDLDNKMDRLGNGIADATFALNNSINGVQTNLGGAITTEGRAIQTQLCAINSNIDNKFAALEKSQLEQRIAEQAAQINQLQMAQMLCGIPKASPYGYNLLPNYACGCGCNQNI